MEIMPKFIILKFARYQVEIEIVFINHVCDAVAIRYHCECLRDPKKEQQKEGTIKNCNIFYNFETKNNNITFTPSITIVIFGRYLRSGKVPMTRHGIRRVGKQARFGLIRLDQEAKTLEQK